MGVTPTRACNPVGARFDERFFVPPQVFWNETGVALAAALAKVLPGLPGGPLLLPNCESGSAFSSCFFPFYFFATPAARCFALIGARSAAVLCLKWGYRAASTAS